ncbi:PilN domain-containing protein [Gallaecimonas sp. GXIMD4217]|uniref:PilN domain-containing protein n=1 Tax=Gallaecimonas sp. GXIMD4217 TaxID=3131927 RepID=UPI00311B3872
MANINLLPWREEARERRQKEFLVSLFVMVALTLVLALGVNWVIGQYIDGQLKRNQYMQAQIQVLERAISEINQLKKRKADLEQRMRLIARLRASRNVTAHIFDTVADAVPPGMYFNTLVRQGDDLNAKGKTESNNRVSTLIRYIKESDWLSNPEPRRIKSSGAKAPLSDFDIGIRVRLEGINEITNGGQ